MWEAFIRTDYTRYRAFSLSGGLIYVFEGDDGQPTDIFRPDFGDADERDKSLTPERLARVLESWIYEFRRGEEVRAIEARFLKAGSFTAGAEDFEIES